MISVNFSDKGKNSKQLDVFIGQSNSSAEILLWLNSLGARYTAKHSSCSMNGYTDLIKIYLPDPRATKPVVVFEFRFNADFSNLKVSWKPGAASALLPDQTTWYRYGTRSRLYNRRFDFLISVLPEYGAKHPWTVLQDCLLKIRGNNPDGKIPSAILDCVLPHFTRAMTNRLTTDYNREQFLRMLASLTHGSIKFHATREKMGKHQKRVNGLYLHSMSVVFPWATDLLRQDPDCAMTDSTFRSCKPYTLAILHLIFANESIPIAFALSPSETAISYISLYNHIQEELKVVERGVPEAQRNEAPFTGDEPCPETDETPEEADDGDELGPFVEGMPPAESLPESPPPAQPEEPQRRVSLRRSPHPPHYGDQNSRTLLTKLPVLTDQGTALAALVDWFDLDWKLCHRHIIESVGAKGRVTDFVCRILRCFSVEEYDVERVAILHEIAGREKFFEEVKGWDSVLRLLGRLEDEHPLCVQSTWALWKRLGLPRTTNSAESVNGRLNENTLNQKSFVERVFIVAQHFITRYNSRFSWRDRSLNRNRSKCWPDPASDDSPAKTEFYRTLHRVRPHESLAARKDRPCSLEADRRFFIPRRADSTSVYFPKKVKFPSGWAIEATIGATKEQFPAEPGRPLLLTLPEQSARTQRSRIAWGIAYGLMKSLGQTKWKNIGATIVSWVSIRAGQLKLPDDGIPSLDQARWRNDCWDRWGTYPRVPANETVR
jgi:hypothetical protein